MVPFPISLSDPYARFLGHGVTIDAFDVLCAQLTRDLFAIATFLFFFLVILHKLCSASRELIPLRFFFWLYIYDGYRRVAAQ